MICSPVAVQYEPVHANKDFVSVAVPFTAGQTWTVLQCSSPGHSPRTRYLDKTWCVMGWQEPCAHGKRGCRVAGETYSDWVDRITMVPLLCWCDSGASIGQLEIRGVGCTENSCSVCAVEGHESKWLIGTLQAELRMFQLLRTVGFCYIKLHRS